MEKSVINCLTDCSAICCKQNSLFRISFNFSPEEAKMMISAGANLTPNKNNDEYYMAQDCPFLTENKCDLHNKLQQPECCRDNFAGDMFCQGLRFRVQNNKRFNDVE